MSTTTCTGAGFTLTPTDGINGVVPAGTLYSWSAPTGSGFTGGAGATNATNISGTLINATNAAVTATYIVTPLSGSSTGASFTVTVTVNPVAAINAMSSVMCSGTSFTLTPTNGTNGVVPAGTTYSWAVPAMSAGLSGGLTGASSTNISGALANATTGALTATYIVTTLSAGSCTGAAFTVTITVNPAATVTAITDTINTGVTFTETPANIVNGIVPAGTTYSWLFPTGTGITGGTSATGATTISGTLTNTTSIARTATYIVTPTSGSCTGTPFTVTITVNPVARITGLTAVTCSGVTFSITPVNDDVNNVVPAGTTYSWSLPTNAGFTGGATAMGASNISGTLINTTNTSVTATYIVTPLSGSATGAAFTVTVTVKPVATITVMSATICSGTAFALTPVNGTNGIVPAGTTYSWLAPAGTGFTGGASATGAAGISGTPVNTTTSAVTATYTVTPLSGFCAGLPFTVTVLIKPLPVLTSGLTPTSVNGGTVFAYTPTANITVNAFSWTRAAVAGIDNTATSAREALTKYLTAPLQ